VAEQCSLTAARHGVDGTAAARRREFVNRRRGPRDEINTCIACNQACSTTSSSASGVCL